MSKVNFTFTTRYSVLRQTPPTKPFISKKKLIKVLYKFKYNKIYIY